MTEPIANVTLDDVSRLGSLGSQRQAMSDVTRGLNHLGTANILPMNTDAKGFIFATRPQMNLSTQNVRAIRRFTMLTTQDRMTLQRAVRVLLDPDLVADNPKLGTPLVENKLALIPWFTNLLQTLTGWPDEQVDVWTSPAGLEGQQWSMIDSTYEINNKFSLNATFQNFSGDPISALFDPWIKIPAAMFKGVMIPRFFSMTSRRLDYTTRIYRFVTDPTMTYIQKWAATCASFPIGIDNGRQLDYDVNKLYQSPGEFSSVQFECIGARYNDPIMLFAFNNAMSMCNDQLKDAVRETNMRKIERPIRHLFNYKGYPWINIETMELEWWVPVEVYNAEINRISATINGLTK